MIFLNFILLFIFQPTQIKRLQLFLFINPNQKKLIQSHPPIGGFTCIAFVSLFANLYYPNYMMMKYLIQPLAQHHQNNISKPNFKKN